jgi:hypothetical protein
MQSASGPGDRIASASDVVTYFRDDCRTARDAMQLEMIVAQYALRLRDVLTPEGVPVGDAACAGVVAELERHGDPLSHAILRALAHLGTSDLARRAGEAAERLAGAGVALPAAVADVAQARAVGAWRDTNGAPGGEYALFIDFEHPLGAGHAIAIFVEPRHGGTIKHIGVMQPMSGLEADDPFHPNAVEAMEIPAALVLLRETVERTFRPSLELADDYRVLMAAARASAAPAPAL